jgi:hypothetical protein
MVAAIKEWMVVGVVRVVTALVVLISANHCFLEEGLARQVSHVQAVPPSKVLDYHFGAAFPHQHIPSESDQHSEDQHPHGDAMSTHSETLSIKARKLDPKIVSLFLLPSIVLVALARKVGDSGAAVDGRLFPLRFESRNSLVSLSCAPQAPPRLV